MEGDAPCSGRVHDHLATVTPHSKCIKGGTSRCPRDRSRERGCGDDGFNELIVIPSRKPTAPARRRERRMAEGSAPPVSSRAKSLSDGQAMAWMAKRVAVTGAG